MTDYIQIHPDDTVAVAVTTAAAIPFGHKMALSDMPEGAAVIKYGHPIGIATKPISAGAHVHTHNVKSGLSERLAYTYAPITKPPLSNRPAETFRGFLRADGRAGTRNEIWIIPTVGCINAIGAAAAKKARRLVRGNITGVYSFPHPYGCSQLGEDHENTKKALCGLIRHPNTGGVLVLGLGCENNGVDGIRAMLGDVDQDRIQFLVCQEHMDEITAALTRVDHLIVAAATDTRTDIPVSKLIVGLKCGGSDGLSGITANPLVGAFTNRLTAVGGSAILTEVPEMFGAETLLMQRCRNEAVFNKTVRLINEFKSYFIRHQQPVYENPSPGNKAGGITTLEEKALGCTQKSGSAEVTDVLRYGEPLRVPGLNLLEAPGNDLVASTALAVSGAQIILFTTGRGTPFGAPVPTLKISSNTALFEHKRNWIDFDAGALLSGEPLDSLAERLFDTVLHTASGRYFTKAEQNGLRDMAIFKTGVTL